MKPGACILTAPLLIRLLLGCVRTRRNFYATDSRASQVSRIFRIVCITLSFIHFRPIICELRAIDASKLNTMNLSKRCVPLGAIRLHLKMHAMVARKLQGNCIVWTQPKKAARAKHYSFPFCRTENMPNLFPLLSAHGRYQLIFSS